MSQKFAFLMHPRRSIRSDMGELLGPLFGLVPTWAWAKAFEHLPLRPMVTGKIYFPHVPDEAAGLLITVPFTPGQLLTLPRAQVQAKIGAAADLARDMGAKLIGLGGLIAPVTAGGKLLARRKDIGITNGNAFTAAMTLAGIERLLPRLPGNPLIAIVGATGSVGSCLTRLLARRHLGRLLLVARNRGRLDALATDARRTDPTVEISTMMEDVARADLVVLLTSASETILRSEHLKGGAIVLDDTVPRNTDPRLLKERPDVVIIDGALVALDGVRIEGAIGLPPSVAYACLAETMLLALDGHEGHFSVGAAEVNQAERMLTLAERWRNLGFALAPFRSFGRMLETPGNDAPIGKAGVQWAA